MEAHNNNPEMVENMTSVSPDATYCDNWIARSFLDFPGGYNMFEMEYSDWGISHDHLHDTTDEEHGMKSVEERMGNIGEVGTHSHDSGEGKTSQHHMVNQANLAAELHGQPSPPAFGDHNEVLDRMMRDRELLPTQYEATEIPELAHVAPAAETIGIGLKHIIARQAVDVFSTISPSPGLPYSRQAAQKATTSQPRNFGTDSHAALIGSHRMQERRGPTDTISTVSGLDNQSEAVFSDSSRIEQDTPITSPEHSRRRTNSTQSARPELKTRAGRRQGSDYARNNILNDRSQSSVKHRCFHCGREYDVPSALRKHQKYLLQRGARPHKCGYCTKDSCDLRDLRRHITKMHPERPVEAPLEAWNPVPCECCHKTYSRRDILLRHLAQEAETCGEYYKQSQSPRPKPRP